MKSSRVVLALVAVAIVVAGVLSSYASGAPDGLNRVAEDKAFAGLEQQHAAEGSPLAGYELDGVEDSRLSIGLAGVVGVGLTFLLGGGIFVAVRRRSTG